MTHALALGRRGQGRCWPNPAVGCVLLRDRRVVGRGWTPPGGRPHAAARGVAVDGATAYVTLEPCAHHGRTPPCADALVAAGVARVVVALRDPDPRTDGGGLARLRAAGIAVTEGVLEEAAARDHAGFLSRVQQGRPRLTLKLATSFDGRIATGSGESRWITGPEARRLVHAERARHDAVLVGGGTARADDPSLTVRDLGRIAQPVRIVASRRLDLPQGARLLRSASDAPVWMLHGPDAADDRIAVLEAAGLRCLAAPLGQDRHLDPEGMLQALGRAGLTSVFCEGGGALAASLLQAGLVDQLIGFTAGVALGAEGRPSLGPLGISALSEAPRFDLIESRAVDGDVLHRWERLG